MAVPAISRRLGAFLVDRHVLSRDHVGELLRVEAQGGPPLPEVLAADALVSEKDLAAATAHTLGVEFVDFDEQIVDPDLWGLVAPDIATNYLAIATHRRSDGTIVVAAKELDDSLVEVIEGDVAEPVVLALAAPVELARVAEEVYGARRASALDGWDEPTPETGAVAEPLPATLADLVNRAAERSTSEVLLTAGRSPMIRTPDGLAPLASWGFLDGSELRRLVWAELDARARERFESTGSATVSVPVPGRGRARLSVFLQRDLMAASIRIGRAVPASLEELGADPEVHELLEADAGLLLVSGEPPEARRTAATAVAAQVAASRSGHLVSVEEPVETLLLHTDATFVHQREVGRDVDTLAQGIASAVDQGADVIVAAPVRDGEAAAAALDAASSGRLVIIDVAGVDAGEAVDRLVALLGADARSAAVHRLGEVLGGALVVRADDGRLGPVTVTADTAVTG